MATKLGVLNLAISISQLTRFSVPLHLEPREYVTLRASIAHKAVMQIKELAQPSPQVHRQSKAQQTH